MFVGTVFGVTDYKFPSKTRSLIGAEVFNANEHPL